MDLNNNNNINSSGSTTTSSSSDIDDDSQHHEHHRLQHHHQQQQQQQQPCRETAVVYHSDTDATISTGTYFRSSGIGGHRRQRLVHGTTTTATTTALSSASSSSSRFLEYRKQHRNSNSTTTTTAGTGTGTATRHNYKYQQQKQQQTWITCLLTLFVATAAAVGIVEWIYLDQIPLIPPFPIMMSMSKSRRWLLSSLKRQKQKQQEQEQQQPHHPAYEFPPEMFKLEQPLEQVMFQLRQQQQLLPAQYQQEEEGEEEEEEEDLDTNYVRDPDKEPILKILRQAGVDTDELEKSAYDQLPTWTQVQELFGPKPIIYGMGNDDDDENDESNCAAFRNNTDPTIRFFGIAGMFNSGTNLLASLMIQNCQITERMLVYGEKSKGVRWQVPWGKHTPAKYRMEHLTRTDKDVPASNSLPLITMRDPYQWMQSMCRHPYTVRGMHDEATCPHLIRSTYNPRRKSPTITRDDLSNVDVYYSNIIVRHATLAHFWNDWYHQYMQADYPRIFVRYEDLLFYGEEVTRKLCRCGGGVPRYPDQFVHIQNSAKVGHQAHGHVKTNLVEAMIRYGNHKHRLDHLTMMDLDIAKQLYDPKLMQMFNYYHPNATEQQQHFLRPSAAVSVSSSAAAV